MEPKILFVDDEQNILDGLRRQLTPGYQVRTAISGTVALDLISSEGPFAVVVADMRMPQMSGLDLLIKVKEVAPRTVRMMLTGNADRKTATEAVQLGQVYSYLTKPCNEKSLTEALDAGLRLYLLQTKIDQMVAKTSTEA